MSITERASFVCPERKNIAVALLRLNRQVYAETKSILYGSNTFRLTLNKESCMRVVGNSAGDKLALTSAIPSLWSSSFRKQIYLIRHLVINVTLDSEGVSSGLTGVAASQKLSQLKMEYLGIVENAIQETCNVLSLSAQIKYVHINFENRSRINIGEEYRIMRPLGTLRGLKKVHIKGTPNNFALLLANLMQQTR